MNYLDFFKKFYYNGGKVFDKISICETEINFSEKTKPFYKLYECDSQYNQLLIKTVKRAYFGEDEHYGKRPFKTSSKSKNNN